MNTTNSNNKVKEIMGKARSVPCSAYLLIALNIVMLTGLVCCDLPLHYFIGMGIFSVLLVAVIGQITSLWKVPSQLMTDSTQARVKQLWEQVQSHAKTLHGDELQSKSVNTIITILLIIYTGSFLNGTLQIFLIVNVLYCLVFLPKQIESLKECWSGCCCDMFKKLKYQG